MVGSNAVNDSTPVIIGVGEASEQIDSPAYRALSPADLAGEAAAAALDDALDRATLAPQISVIAAIRQFEASVPNAVAPFGRADNFPRAVARRIGADPAWAILEPPGGQGPQHLINEFARAIGAGLTDLVLLCGAEAISTVRHLASRGETRDWSETIGGPLEDRGFGDLSASTELARHGVRTAISFYALLENARRARLGASRAEYALEMGRLFAPFTQVAAAHPHAMSREVRTAPELATVTPENRLTSDPYTRRLVSRDQANQGAAVLLTSRGRARALGVPDEKLVYLHGGADVREQAPLERMDLSRGPASVLAAQLALEKAATSLDDVDAFDFYSCFPIAVFNVRDGLGIAADDPRPLTVTGGLPYFGGAGNNYSMHAIAAMVRRLRARPSETGLVAANGGALSKYSVGVYSARPGSRGDFDSQALQAEVDSWPAVPQAMGDGEGVVETYTIDYTGKAPLGIVVGRLNGSQARFVSMTSGGEDAVIQTMIEAEPLGARVEVKPDESGRSIIRAIKPA
jgi:acetyl-CoA C-acetyltransferase